jgi:hypothetical protein
LGIEIRHQTFLIENPMTDQELKDLVAGLAVAQAKTDAQMAKTDAQLAKNSEEIKAMMRRVDSVCARIDSVCARVDSVCAQLGGMANNQGDVAEEFFFHALDRNPVIGGVKFDRVEQHILVGSRGCQTEFDLLLYNGNSLAIIEVKHKVHPKALEQLQQQIARHRECFPEYAHYALYAGIAGMSIPSEVSNEAHEKGFFVLRQQGDVMLVDTEYMRSVAPVS